MSHPTLVLKQDFAATPKMKSLFLHHAVLLYCGREMELLKIVTVYNTGRKQRGCGSIYKLQTTPYVHSKYVKGCPDHICTKLFSLEWEDGSIFESLTGLLLDLSLCSWTPGLELYWMFGDLHTIAKSTECRTTFWCFFTKSCYWKHSISQFEFIRNHNSASTTCTILKKLNKYVQQLWILEFK